MRLQTVLFIAIMSLFSSSAVAEPVVQERLAPLSPHSAALGGPHAALVDGILALTNNPGGFQSSEREIQVAETTLGLAGPIFDITGLAIKGFSGASMDSLLLDPDVQELLNGLYASMHFGGPVSFGYVGGGLGFGVFNWTNLYFKSVGTLTLNTGVAENLLITGGYTFRIPLPELWNSTLDVGMTLRSHLQAGVASTQDILGVIELFGNPASFIGEEPLLLGVGVGADVGLLYTYDNLISFGLCARDLYSPTLVNRYESVEAFRKSQSPTVEAGIVPLDLSAGVQVTPDISDVSLYLSGLKILLDYNDILDVVTHPETARHWILHLGLGVELSMLEILSVRLGFFEGLPSAGLGLDLGILRLDTAMYGRELSTEPGLRPIYNVAIGFTFIL